MSRTAAVASIILVAVTLGSFEVRAARERFASHPRTEWRFHR